MTRNELVECRDLAERMIRFHKQNLDKFPRRANGLTPDSVKTSRDWQYHKSRCRIWFATLRTINTKLTRA